MTVINVYQQDYPPDVTHTEGQYQVTVTETGCLNVTANGNVAIYNKTAWHSVEVTQEDA